MKPISSNSCRVITIAAAVIGTVLSLVTYMEPQATADTASATTPRSAPGGGNNVASPLAAYPSKAIGCGVLTEADCQGAEARSKDENWQTQSEGDDVAYAKAWVAECKMRRTYVGVMRRLTRNPAAVAKLEEAQRRWLALTRDDEKAHFPHIDEAGYYGSVLPMCLGIEEESQSAARAEELHILASCQEDPAGPNVAREAARLEDITMNDTYQKVRTAFAKDPIFIAALTRAQRTWIAYRDAQVAFVAAATGGRDGTCAARELARETKERTEYLDAWLAPADDGDACPGSQELL